MRYEYAVSDIIGAVILIGVVMGAMGILGVILLSTPPPEETPKVSISSYCVRCDPDGTYEVIMYHGGGEVVETDPTLTQFILYFEDGSSKKIDPWLVYESSPEDCMFTDIGESSSSGRGLWGSSDFWKSGETLRFRFFSLIEPSGIDVRYYPFTSAMSKAEFKDEIRNSTCVTDPTVGCNDPTSELIPVLISPKDGDHSGCNPDCSGNNCQATFKYNLSSGNYNIPVHKSGKPWNSFVGQGDPEIKSCTDVNCDDFTSDGSMNDIVKVNFSSSVEWWLGRTKSEKATCG